MSKNQICHFEIGVKDTRKAAEFYSQLFDWNMEPRPGASASEGSPPAIMMRTGGDVGGHLNALGHEPHNYTIFYILVDDVAAAISRAESLGGSRLVGPLPVPGSGTFAWIKDPEGNVIGVYTHQ
ncbi:MAG: VOC family protein [Acidobacteria bacterium]|nr:VOC family protein [Acidobacteriota bacterium]